MDTITHNDYLKEIASKNNEFLQKHSPYIQEIDEMKNSQTWTYNDLKDKTAVRNFLLQQIVAYNRDLQNIPQETELNDTRRMLNNYDAHALSAWEGLDKLNTIIAETNKDISPSMIFNAQRSLHALHYNKGLGNKQVGYLNSLPDGTYGFLYRLQTGDKSKPQTLKEAGERAETVLNAELDNLLKKVHSCVETFITDMQGKHINVYDGEIIKDFINQSCLQSQCYGCVTQEENKMRIAKNQTSAEQMPSY
jgi:hypothetical protein